MNTFLLFPKNNLIIRIPLHYTYIDVSYMDQHIMVLRADTVMRYGCSAVMTCEGKMSMLDPTNAAPPSGRFGDGRSVSSIHHDGLDLQQG